MHNGYAEFSTYSNTAQHALVNNLPVNHSVCTTSGLETISELDENELVLDGSSVISFIETKKNACNFKYYKMPQ